MTPIEELNKLLNELEDYEIVKRLGGAVRRLEKENSGHNYRQQAEFYRNKYESYHEAIRGASEFIAKFPPRTAGKTKISEILLVALNGDVTNLQRATTRDSKGGIGMSKERLEEMKGVLESWRAWNDWNESQRKVLKDLACVLEHVRELEEDYEYLSHYYGLETEQNKRYREGIEKSTMIIKSLPRTSGKTQLYSLLNEALEGEK